MGDCCRRGWAYLCIDLCIELREPGGLGSFARVLGNPEHYDNYRHLEQFTLLRSQVLTAKEGRVP